jgi:lysophospholipase L1-like esterase
MSLKNAFKIILAIALSFLVFFVIGEFAIRIYLKHNTIYDVEMTRYAMKVKTDADNPLIGHVHRPNVTEHLMNTTVKINSDGMRDREYHVTKNNSYRIIALGDSLTFGWGVEEEDSYSSLLEKEINKRYPAEIINFGAGNYNTVQEVNLFLEKGLKYKPDKVVLFYFINDAEITPQKSKLWFLGYSQLITFYWSRINAFINKNFSSKSFSEFYSNLYRESYEGWIKSREALLLLKNICEKEDIYLQVILLPELHDVNNEIFKGVYNKIADFLMENDIDYLNLAPLFKGRKNPMELWVSYDDAHPNELAHKKIAESALAFISKKERNERERVPHEI